jgi:hypothetical protein
MNALNFDGVSRNPKHPSSTRPAEWTAPRWSWASFNCSITTPKPMRDHSLIGVNVVGLDKGDDARLQRQAKLVVQVDLHSVNMTYNLRWDKLMVFMNPARCTHETSSRCRMGRRDSLPPNLVMPSVPRASRSWRI